MTSRFERMSLVLGCAAVAACAGGSDRRSAASDAVTAPAAALPRAEMVASAAPPSPAAQASDAAAGTDLRSQKLIRKGELRIQVKDAGKAVSLADTIVRDAGGVIADSRMQQNADGSRDAMVVVRVPSTRFGEATTALRKLGDVRGEMVNTQDVTREYADVATRLAVKEQTVVRLRALLDSRTAKLADVLEVERELARTITELEQLKGEQKYFDQEAATSTITVNLFEREGPSTAGFMAPIGAAFGSALGTLGTSLSVLISLVAFGLPWAVLAVVGWRVYLHFGGTLRAVRSPVARPSPKSAAQSAPELAPRERLDGDPR